MSRGGATADQATGRPTSEKVKGIFSRIAPSYDTFNRLASLGIDRSWRRATVEAACLTPESHVLDLAAGTGDLALALAQQGAPAEVLATDFVPEMLEIAHQKAAKYRGATRIEFQVADAQALPIPNETFDAATVAFGVRNFPNRMANFMEVLRVLKPRGRYVVLEFSRPRNKLFRGLYHFYLRHVIPNLGALVAGDKASFVYLNDSIRQFPDQEALASELRCAGFSNVDYTNLTGGIVAIHVAVK
jgi:demethylmenaquinone methyltransferase / 2-methoxy-6-polyprenyl-1,4-benzoquinol methylase